MARHIRRRDLSPMEWFRYIGAGNHVFFADDRVEVDPVTGYSQPIYTDRRLEEDNRLGDPASAYLTRDWLVEQIDDPPDPRDDASIRFSLLELD